MYAKYDGGVRVGVAYNKFETFKSKDVHWTGLNTTLKIDKGLMAAIAKKELRTLMRQRLSHLSPEFLNRQCL